MNMKYLFIIFAMLLTAAAPVRERGKWIIDYNSQLLIHGKTNVNSFTCFISCYNNIDTLNYELDSKSKALVFEANKMIIPMFNFNCGNPMITKDFRTTVIANKYPYLNIVFVSLDKNRDEGKAVAKLQISLAGVVKSITVDFLLKPKGDFLNLTGKHVVHFSDFGLKAPKRMMGMVKVQEELNVEFNLLLKPVL